MSQPKKYKIVDPNGVKLFDKTLAPGDVVEIDSGPHRDAWLRFGQIEEAEGKKAKKAADTP